MISLAHIPVLSAIVDHMDEGLVVYDEHGAVVFSNAPGGCCIKGHKNIKDVLETSVTVAGHTYRAELYVIDHSARQCGC